MQIVEKKISELVEYEGNPRINDDAVEPVAQSIKSFGFKQPIVIDRNNTIVCGHTRLKAAIKLGMEGVPCVIADDLTEDEVKAYRLVDNKTAEYAQWNYELLDSELKMIEFDLGDWQFDESALADISTIPDIPKEIGYAEKFGVVVDCNDEAEQKSAFELVHGAGYNARIVSI
jgi:hypothetical protein